MTPEKPANPQEQMEARLTAYLLGELPAHEAAALRQKLDEDMQLAKLCDRLRPTINLVKEVAASPSPQGGMQAAALRLSEERRQKLLAQFKTVRPKEFAEAPRTRRTVARLSLEMAAVLVLLGMVAAVVLPKFSGATMKARNDMGDGNQARFRGQYSMEKQVEPVEREPDGKQNEVIRKIAVLTPSAPVQTGNSTRMVIILPKVETEVATGVVGTNGIWGNYFQGVGNNPGLNTQISQSEQVTIKAGSGDAWTMSGTTRGFYDDNYPTVQSNNAPVAIEGSGKADGFNLNVVDLNLDKYAAVQPVAPMLTLGVTTGQAATASDETLASDLKSRQLLAQRISGIVSRASRVSGDEEDRIKAGADAVVLDGKTTQSTNSGPRVVAGTYNGGNDGQATSQYSQTVTIDGNAVPVEVQTDVIGGKSGIGGGGRGGIGGRARGGAGGGGMGGAVAMGGFPGRGGPAVAQTDPRNPFAALGAGTAGLSPLSDRAKSGEQVMNQGATSAFSTSVVNTAVIGTSATAASSSLADDGQIIPVATLNIVQSARELPKVEMPKEASAPALKGTPADSSQDVKLAYANPAAVSRALRLRDGRMTNQTPELGDAPLKQGLIVTASTQSAMSEAPPTPSFGFSGIPVAAPPATIVTNGIVMNSGSFSRKAGQVDQQSSGGRGARDYPNATESGEATVALDQEGHGIVVLADDNTFAQMSNVVVNLNARDEAAGVRPMNEAIRLPRNGAPTVPPTIPDSGAENSTASGTNSSDVYSLKIVGYVNIPTTPLAIDSMNTFTGASNATGTTKDDVSSLKRLLTNGGPQSGQPRLGADLSSPVYLPSVASSPTDSSGAVNVLKYNYVKTDASTQLAQADMAKKLAESDAKSDAAMRQVDKAWNDAPRQLALNKDYLDKKQELEKLNGVRDVLTANAGMSTSLGHNPVEIVELAKPESATKPTLWGRIGEALNGKVERKARIELNRDVTDVQGVSGERATNRSYDPYFVQTETEALQSDAVLDKVIEKLKLNETWANKEGSGTALSMSDTRQRLRKSLDLRASPNSNLLEIGVKSKNPEEAALIANTVAEAYTDFRRKTSEQISGATIESAKLELAEQDKKIAQAKVELAQIEKTAAPQQVDAAPARPALPPLVPQPEVLTSENAFSTFSLNVSDVSFKLAAASLEKGLMPEPGSIRSEEFINAFDYRDPAPAPGAPLGFAWDRVRYPFAHNRDLVRFAVKTAAAGREPGRPMNIVLLLDNSGSMERADRVAIIHEALRVLAGQLQPQDTLSVVTFARTARLFVDGVSGDKAGAIAEQVSGLTPEGGTNLEEAMRLAYETALRHYLANGVNRVVLLTDGAANLGNVDPTALKEKVETNRKQGIALDCFGIGWEDYNDDLLEVLSRNGDGRYGFINTPAEAATGFAGQLAGALHVAAADVKVQIEFNPKRVTAYRQIGYAKHQLTKEQFRDNTVDAAEIGAAEAGNALYTVEINPAGEGPIGTVRVRSRTPGTQDFQEHEWTLPYSGNAPALDQGSAATRLAATAGAFSEWLGASPFAAEVTPDQLLGYLSGVPEVYGVDGRPKKLEWMIRQAKSVTGK